MMDIDTAYEVGDGVTVEFDGVELWFRSSNSSFSLVLTPSQMRRLIPLITSIDWEQAERGVRWPSRC